MILQSDKDEFGYDDAIRDIPELFLSGEFMARNEDSFGTSSKSSETHLLSDIYRAYREGLFHPPIFFNDRD